VRYLALGPIDAISSEGAASRGIAVALGAPKQRLVFAALLARAPHLVPVSRLTDTLWPAGAPTTAGNLIQGYVAGLRRSLGAHAIETRPPGYVLPVPDAGIDALDFEAALRVGRDSVAAGALETAVEHFDIGLALWRDDAFADIASGLLPEATRLDELRLACADERFDALLALGREADIISELQALVAAHPLRERGWAQLMLALYRHGRQAEALRAFDTVRELLVDELGIDPSSELTEMHARILRQDPALAAPPRPSNAPTRPVHPEPVVGAVSDGEPFIGRSAELDLLRSAWDAAASGQSRTVILGGEPGIGKTRLAQAAMAELEAAGAAVLYGRCDEDVLSPFQPFVEGLAVALPALTPDAMAAVTPEQLGDLCRLVPGLAARLPEGTVADRPAADHSMLWLVDAFARLLDAIAAPNGLAIVVDDLHFSDATTLTLLKHLVRRACPRTLIIATYRTTDLDATHPLLDVLAELRRDTSVERVMLTGLAPNDVEALLAASIDDSGAGTREGTALALHRETRGNPLYLTQLLRHTDVDDIAMGVLPLERDVPSAIIELTTSRVQRLSPECASTIRVMAVLGTTVEVDVLELVVGEPVLDQLEEAAAAGLVVEEATMRLPSYSFTHSLVRRALVETVSRTRQRAVHARAVDAIIGVVGTGDDTLLRLARHVRQASGAVDNERAAEILLAGADVANRGWAKMEAVELYDAAIGVLTPDDPRRRRAEVKRAVAGPAAFHGRFDERSIRAAHQRGDHDHTD
jgi:DNA-binding SARP family transcriptional activator